MAGTAVAQDVVRDLRCKIAKIEGVLAQPLAVPAARAAARTAASAAALPGTGEPSLLAGAALPGDAVAAGAPAPGAGEVTVLRRKGVPEKPPVSTGAMRFDAAIGGLPSAGLVEIHGATTRDAGAVAGFALALAGILSRGTRLPLVWISTSEVLREAGRPYAPGLSERFGISPGELLLAEAQKLSDVLWIAEETASLGAVGAILLEIRGTPRQLDLTATRRLHRRALSAGHPLFLLRQAGAAQPTAAPLRLVVSPAPAGSRLTLAGPLQGSIGPPAFHVLVGKSRTSPPVSFTLEWTPGAHVFEERAHEPAPTHTRPVVALSAGRADLSPALREIVAFPGATADAASGDQPPGRQHAAHSRSRRAG